MSALSVVCQRDELIIGGMEGLEYDPDMIVDKEISFNLSRGIFPPIFHKFRSRGIYVLRYFKNFEWIYVIIDERLPVKIETTDEGENMKLVFGGCKDPSEMWVQLIEKGYAKLHGCYGNLISGYIDEGIQELTGFQPEKILIKNENTNSFPHQ
jgi:calpain